MKSISFEYIETKQGYITFNKAVVSGEFSGSSNFCLSIDALSDAIIYINKIYVELNGEFQINDYDSNDFILFKVEKYGHVKISGQVGGTHRKQYLVYEMDTDQTFLKEIISNLEKLINT